MPSIYDVAAGLDTRGVIGPALETGARIRLAEQTALEQPQRFAREKQGWQRQDETYATQKRLTAESEALGKMQMIASTSQTPQTFLKYLSQMDPTGESPFFKSLTENVRSSIGKPEAWTNIQGNLVDMMGSLKRATDVNVEQIRGGFNVQEAEIRNAGQLAATKEGDKGAMARTKLEIASQEKQAEAGRTFARELATVKANSTGVKLETMQWIYDTAWQNILTMYRDKQTGEWYPKTPFYKPATAPWFGFNTEESFDSKMLQDMIEREAINVAKTIGYEMKQAPTTTGTGTKPKFSVTQP